MSSFSLPLFRPHPLVRGGHAQTLAAYYWPGKHPCQANPEREALAVGERRAAHFSA
jgi:hypothetical protein